MYGIYSGVNAIKSKTAAVFLSVVGIVMASFMLSSAFASEATSVGGNWRVYNYKPATSSWDINKTQSDGNGGVQFPFQQFQSPSTGSFAVYLENNYNVSLTEDQTITATASWTPGAYKTRSTTFPGAYARAEFQDVASGKYTSNDYWWYSGNTLDLNATSNGTLTAPLADRSHWTNVCGQLATDTTPHPGPNCVGGTDPAVSPYDGFTNAMKNVKQVSLSFGSAGSYASGVAAEGTDSATFDMTSFAAAS